MGLALLGDKLPAAQAEAWGLIWRCVDDDELMSTALAAARQLAAGPTRGYVRTREAMEAGLKLVARSRARSRARLPARTRPHCPTIAKV